MKADDGLPETSTRRSALLGILLRRCPRCRQGRVFHAAWVMNENCPVCGLDFDRGEPGYFTGAMYASYALAIPLISFLTLIEFLIVRTWSLFHLVLLATLICVPLVPWIWQYSRVVWMTFDRYLDPGDEREQPPGSEP
jgi:uncharacterized protein (DUF983 family)